MMKKRRDQILAGLLVIQAIVAVIALWPRAAVGQSQPVFGTLKATDIVALTVTDDKGATISLRQVDGQWGMPEADNYPALAEKISPVLDKLAGLTTRTMVARTEASYDRLQVSPNNFVRKLDFETSSGEKHTVFLGSSPSYGATNYRVDGQKEVYLADNITTWEIGADPASWVDVTYLRVPSDQVVGVTVQNAQGTLSFSKGDDGKWSMDGLRPGDVLDPNKVTGLLNLFSSFSMMRPLGKEAKAEYGLDNPTAILTMQTVSSTVTLKVGAQDPTDKSYYVSASSSPYYARASAGAIQQLIGKTYEEMLQPPPTATPAPTAGSAALTPTLTLAPTGSAVLTPTLTLAPTGSAALTPTLTLAPTGTLTVTTTPEPTAKP